MGLIEGLGMETMLSDVQRMDKRQVNIEFMKTIMSRCLLYGARLRHNSLFVYKLNQMISNSSFYIKYLALE